MSCRSSLTRTSLERFIQTTHDEYQHLVEVERGGLRASFNKEFFISPLLIIYTPSRASRDYLARSFVHLRCRSGSHHNHD